MEFEDVSLAMVRFENGAVASVVNSLLSPRELSRIRIDTTAGTLEVNHVYGYSDADWSFVPVPPASAAASLGKDPGTRDTTGALRDSTPTSDGANDVWAASAGIDVPSNHAAQITRLVDDLLAGRTHQTTLASTRSTLEFVGVYASALLGTTILRATRAWPPVLRRLERRDGCRRHHRTDDLTALHPFPDQFGGARLTGSPEETACASAD